MAKNTSPFIALLRGINVGGKNIIAKDDLRECFENLGLHDVQTYIQSGNVLFRSQSRSIKHLKTTIESALASTFDYNAKVVVLSRKQYDSDLQSAPKKWGEDETRKHNALFLLDNLKPTDVLAQLPSPNPEHETVGTGKATIFWSVSKAYLGKSTMMKLASMPVYKQMTVRNHNTTRKLLALLNDM